MQWASRLQSHRWLLFCQSLQWHNSKCGDQQEGRSSHTQRINSNSDSRRADQARFPTCNTAPLLGSSKSTNHRLADSHSHFDNDIDTHSPLSIPDIPKLAKSGLWWWWNNAVSHGKAVSWQWFQSDISVGLFNPLPWRRKWALVKPQYQNLIVPDSPLPVRILVHRPRRRYIRQCRVRAEFPSIQTELWK